MALSKIDPAGLDIGQIGGRRNLIINGAMQVAQRGTSASSYTSDNYSTVDRFKTRVGTLGAWTISQSTDVPSGSGFAKSLKFDCTTADASPASTDYLLIEHKIEGQDLQHLKYGTSSAETITLTFWVKSNKTGTAQVNLRDYDNDKLLSDTYTISSANTWEKKTLTYIGNTSDSLDNDNNASLALEWWLDSGSTYTGGTAPTAWETRAQSDRNANNLGLGDNTANELYITGVQLEVGSVATPFEHRSYGEERELCKRYCHVVNESELGFYYVDVVSIFNSTTAHWLPKVRMRTYPSVSGTGSDWVLVVDNGTKAVSSFTQRGNGTQFSDGDSGLIEVASTAGLTQGKAAALRVATASGTGKKIILDAEL